MRPLFKWTVIGVCATYVLLMLGLIVKGLTDGHLFVALAMSWPVVNATQFALDLYREGRD